MLKILSPLGVRPHAVKAACLVGDVEDSENQVSFAITGQQSDILGRVLSENQRRKVQKFVVATSIDFSYEKSVRFLSDTLRSGGYSAVLSIGDTKTSLCAALAAKSANVMLVHYESGLRSTIRTLEERIRRKIDRITDLHLCYNEQCAVTLNAEGVSRSRIQVVGSLYEESLATSLNEASSYDGMYEGMIVVALHRKENRWNAQNAAALSRQLNDFSQKKLLICHPSNSNHMISSVKSHSDQWIVAKEMENPFFVRVLSDATAVVTDSAGIAEQSFLLNKPTIILRDCTERPWILGPRSRLAGLSKLSSVLSDVLARSSSMSPQLDCKASRRILEVLGSI
ncbi:UDP-N-acetylglucosamine 2-epimerase [Rhizobium sp. SL86]|uniref:UDP-N-acetylglucosamine 2-epimerase n=1 Tax=Rhizobium sp. SL86 TaxID=2995148 RepID=UPI0022728362|nr:UDP-N-acetylglucosamine 2-epimerase [Rhizobium sp. SL86]MCY1665847.1 UDP-N-acetylglucosamine 2-epimerase [Rhizobium sp. SL86]